MTEIDKKKVRELWENGMPLMQIWRMMPISLYYYRKGIREMKKNGEFSGVRKNNEAKVVEAFDNGERNVSNIARIYGLSKNTVYIYLHKNGRFLGRKTRHWVHSDRTTSIIDDLKEGLLTQSKIANIYGVTRQYIHILKRKLEKGLI